MPKPIETLMNEHRIIERVLGSLATFAERIDSGIEDERAILRDYVSFFQGFADRCHHGKEEDILFAKMASWGFPHETGPLAVMGMEHVLGRQHIGILASLAEGSKPLTREERKTLRIHALAYIELLLMHIQKEDNILYPMALRAIPDSEMEALADRFDDFEAREMPRGGHEQWLTLAEHLVAVFPPDSSRLATTVRGGACCGPLADFS